MFFALRTLAKMPKRHCNMSILAKSIKYSKNGEPAEVLKLVEEKIEPPKGNQVLVRVLAAPINPADINTIQGKYPLKPELPATGGNECVAVVLDVGEQVTKVCKGQHVVPFGWGLGTWTTHALFTEEKLIPICEKIGIPEAATLTVNPCTAYRMLKDFVHLLPGDCIIQNGANSAVGQAVHQLCYVWQLHSVGVVRDRPEIAKLKEHLKDLGATEVLTEEEISKTNIFKDGLLPKPRLALNCVGGDSAAAVTRQLDENGVMVTYGGMARKPVPVSTAALIFKDIAFRGFWVTRWSTQEGIDSLRREQMFAELSYLMQKQKLVAPSYEMVPLESYKEAAAAVLDTKGFIGKKFIFNLEQS